MRHPIAAELRHAEVQGARPGIARLDDVGIRQREVAAGWTDADGLHLVVRDRKLEPQIDRPTPAIDMAVPAVGMEVRPGPSFQGLADIGRIGEPALPGGRAGVERREWLPILLGPADEARFREDDELVASVGPRADSIAPAGTPGRTPTRCCDTTCTGCGCGTTTRDSASRRGPPSRRHRPGPGRHRPGRPARHTCRRTSPRHRNAAVASPAAGRPGRWTSPGPRPWGTACGSYASPPCRGSAWPAV